jgi:hypothetical protein
MFCANIAVGTENKGHVSVIIPRGLITTSGTPVVIGAHNSWKYFTVKVNSTGDSAIMTIMGTGHEGGGIKAASARMYGLF